LAHFQAGVMKRMGAVSIGPFVGLSLGMFLYNNGTSTVNGRETTDEHTIPEPSLHEWLTFGIRGTYQMGP
ncbi:MAG: hypothetical protein U0165_12495, partial [Polyangiaceae bacterium]